MAYIRQDVHGTSGQDILKINENFMNIFEKVFGDINYSDVDKELQKRINKQWIPVQGEGNLDSSNPLRIRFYIPPNTTKIVSSNFNLMAENYRMDSSITDSLESKEEVVSIISSTQPKTTQTSTMQPTQTRSSNVAPAQTKTASSTTVGVSSVSSATVGVAGVSGGGSTSEVGGYSTFFVDRWGVFGGSRYYAPTQAWRPNGTQTSIGGGYFYNAGRDDMALGTNPAYVSGQKVLFIDMYSLQHSHEIPSHYHTIKPHSHSVSLQGHSHNVTMQPHSHDIVIDGHYHTVEIPSHTHDVEIPPHTHDVNGTVTIPSHSHKLNEGVKTSTVKPVNVRFSINGNYFNTINGISSANDIDISEFIKVGEWNVIEITSDTVARAVVYGTVELIAI